MICGKRSANQVRKADPTTVNGREYVARQSIALPTIHIRQLFSQFQMQVEKASKQKPEAHIYSTLPDLTERRGAPARGTELEDRTGKARVLITGGLQQGAYTAGEKREGASNWLLLL